MFKLILILIAGGTSFEGGTTITTFETRFNTLDQCMHVRNHYANTLMAQFKGQTSKVGDRYYREFQLSAECFKE